MSVAPVGTSGTADRQQLDWRFRSLEGMSVVHSLIYVCLLAIWIFDGPPRLRNVFGWAHGLMWIAMTVLVLIAARKAIVSFRLAVLVAVIGGLGPFAGTAGFVWEGRRRQTVKEVPMAASDASRESR